MFGRPTSEKVSKTRSHATHVMPHSGDIWQNAHASHPARPARNLDAELFHPRICCLMVLQPRSTARDGSCLCFGVFSIPTVTVTPTTWRIIAVSRWLVTPIDKPFRPVLASFSSRGRRCKHHCLGCLKLTPPTRWAQSHQI